MTKLKIENGCRGPNFQIKAEDMYKNIVIKRSPR